MDFDFFAVLEILKHLLKKDSNNIENLEAVKNVIEFRMDVSL